MVNYMGDRAAEISLVTAQYAADGSLTAVDFTAAPIGVGMQKEYALEDVEIRQDTVRVAVFLWEQQSMRPIPMIV